MSLAEKIRQIYARYPEMVTKGDVEGILALYRDDATIEDPIGSDLHRGIDAIRKFYEAAAGSVVMKRIGPVHVAGGEAATPLLVLIGPEGKQQLFGFQGLAIHDRTAYEAFTIPHQPRHVARHDRRTARHRICLLR